MAATKIIDAQAIQAAGKGLFAVKQAITAGAYVVSASLVNTGAQLANYVPKIRFVSSPEDLTAANVPGRMASVGELKLHLPKADAAIIEGSAEMEFAAGGFLYAWLDNDQALDEAANLTVWVNEIE